jgi:hypothetical protein
MVAVIDALLNRVNLLSFIVVVGAKSSVAGTHSKQQRNYPEYHFFHQ